MVRRWRQLLRKAAVVLKERGHTKDQLEDGEGRVCLFGALNVAAHGDPFHSHQGPNGEYPGAVKALCAALKVNSSLDVADWNNKPSRKRYEVIRLLEKVAG